MQQLPEALRPLAGFRQFILWKTFQRGEKLVKLPISPHTFESFEKGADWQNDPQSLTDADTAIKYAAMMGDGYGVGFLFTPNDPFFFVDIDKCLNADNATWSPVAMDLMTRLNGAAVEVSQSGRGLHIIGQGRAPDHSCKNIALGVEMYTEGRFVALTGTNAVGSAAVDCTAALVPLVDAYFPAKAATKGQEWTEEAVEGSTPPETDEELIEKALRSGGASSIFGNKTTFAALWEGDEDELAKAYADENRAYDASSADAALAQHLAFWTGNNCDRVLRIMWQSGLVRDKWQREDYLIRTITRAASLQETFYTGGKQRDEDRVKIEVAGDPLGNVEQGAPELLAGYQFLGATQQIEHFTGCVYVQSLHKVFTPRGLFLKQDQFNATYGGYHFQIDDTGKATKKAWEAFTESQLIRYPKAEFGCFRPELPPGTLIQEEGHIFVNTYVPIETPSQKGDATPFLSHLTKLLPNQGDRDILLAYMAACVQHKGVKFQWAPLLQGAEGNGKTLFTRCVAFAVGARYTHLPPASEIAEKFNEWLFGKVFIGIEDVYVPDHKKEVIEVLKPMITNDRLAMRAMQAAQVMGDNRANFMLNSNHKDAIRKTRTDRRFAVFYTAQQSEEDLTRDGMQGDYFPDLYDWLRNGGGYAIVADFLMTYAIPEELNPATKCHRAPITSSTNEAIAASMGGIEQDILEAIEEGRPGFAGGWISSVAVERLLNDARMTRAIPHNKRRDLLKSLGYDWHPSLNNGRVNNPIPLDDNKKPRLFIKDGHIARNVTGPAEVARMYQEAQGAPAAATGKAVEVFKG